MRKWKPVTESYLGNPLANSQGCDEPRDPAFKERFQDGQILNGRGSQGNVGGPSGAKAPSYKANPGSGKLHGSYPSKSQKLRG